MRRGVRQGRALRPVCGPRPDTPTLTLRARAPYPRGMSASRWLRSVRPLVGLLALCAFLVSVLGASTAEAQRRRRRREEEPAVPAATTPATIVLIGEAPGAEVLIDEHVVGTLPLGEALSVEPGTHTLRIRRPGFTEYTEVVTLGPGESYDVFVDLMALSQVLEVESTPPGAHVFVDETFLGDTPAEIELLDGSHRLRVSLPGFEEITRDITAVAGARETLTFELVAIPLDDGEQWYESPWTWVGIGGGLVAIAVIAIVIAVVVTDNEASQTDRFCAGGMYPCFVVTGF